MDKNIIYNDLKCICENIYKDESMKKHTSFKTGGMADILIEPTNTEQIKQILEYCKINNISYYVIGNGTNLLVKDGGFRGIIIKISHKMNKFVIDGTKIIADAGASIIALSQSAYKNGLTGFEFACGIPGSVGGAVRMNAGAFKGEMSNIVEYTTYIDELGNICTIDNLSHNFKYRNTIFENSKYIILSVTFKLNYGDKDKIKEKMDENNMIRKSKQPLGTYNAGSSFKRLDNYFPGKLIEDAGLKGYKIGGAEVSNVHANFIVNTGNASSKDILNLFEYVQKIVKNKFDVNLELEVQIIGED